MGQVQDLEQAVGRAGGLEGTGDALATERCLRRVFQDHRVARHDRGHDGVDRRQIGIIPGGDDQDRAQGLASDEAGEAGVVRCRTVGERRLGDGNHMPGPFLEPADLSRAIAHGPAHLPSKLFRNRSLVGDEGIDHAGADDGPLGDRHAPPDRLAGGGAVEGGADRRVLGSKALGIGRSVDGGNAGEDFGHGGLSFRLVARLRWKTES